MISFGHPFAEQDGPADVRIIFKEHSNDVAEIEKTFRAHQPQLLVLSRYTSERGLDWIRLARDAAVPVVFHIDDDLLAVPASLGEAKYKAYNSPERLRALRQNIESSDLLYVSTNELAKRFEGHGIKTPIVAGRIYCSVAPLEVGALLPPASGPVVGYMGTSGHSADLAMILPAICQVMELVPDLQFEVFGTIAMPPEMERFGRRVRHIPSVPDYEGFLDRLRGLGWWVGLAPLEDNAFNRCKADTKWVEYSVAGIAVIASDLPVYEQACADGAGILARSNAQWAEALLELLYRPDVRKRAIDRAQAKLRNGYDRKDLRAQVVEVFDRAVATRAQVRLS
jgi:glycosyltransferase involved in cell wall biosynthesis